MQATHLYPIRKAQTAAHVIAAGRCSLDVLAIKGNVLQETQSHERPGLPMSKSNAKQPKLRLSTGSS
eukprot:1160900-Pelagomonas_calceolata.AAC.4